VEALTVVQTVALAIALAACAGLRAWLPLLLAAGLSRLEILELGPQFGFLRSNQALALLLLATLIEIVADKIPALDHALDGLSTVLRPAAGVVLAASVLGTVSDPLTAWVFGAATGAPAALVPHAAKTGVRLASSLFTAGLGNPIVSVVEDAATLAAFLLALVAPVLVALGVVALAWVVLRRLFRRRIVSPA